MPRRHAAQHPTRRTLLASFAGLAALGATRPASAQSAAGWPQRPVRLLVPFAAGGNIDVMGRLMAQRLSETLGQQFIVENRVGIVATEAVARSAPDGYTLLWASTNVIAIVPATGKVPYDPVKDFAPVSALGTSPQVLLAHGKLPVKSVAELVSWVKAQPGKVAYGGGGGPGSASNLIMQLFLKRAGLEMTSVSYRGTAPALTDLIAGHIPTTFVPVSEAHAQANNPNVRMLAVSSATRARRVPDVPAIAETYPGFHAVSWTGMLAPAATPREMVEKLASVMVDAGKDPKFVDQLTTHGIDLLTEGPAKFAAMIASEIPVWAEAVRIAGVKVEQ
jgi:tripartite-type tricarboxylate transporter receptor subunit TctC